MFTMGSDFQYSDADMWYKNLDKLIKYVNEKVRNLRIFGRSMIYRDIS